MERVPRQDTTPEGDATETDASDDGAPFGGSRLPIVGGLTLVGAVAGNLVVQALVAGGTLPEGTAATTLPVLAAVGLVGLLVLVGSVLRR